MTIDQLVLINYRSWKDCVISFSDSTPQIFIGLNDSGKSSILHGLDLLLGEKPKYYSISDGKNFRSDLIFFYLYQNDDTCRELQEYVYVSIHITNVIFPSGFMQKQTNTSQNL